MKTSAFRNTGETNYLINKIFHAGSIKKSFWKELCAVAMLFEEMTQKTFFGVYCCRWQTLQKKLQNPLAF